MQQKEKNELSREKILSAAIAEFGKKGYDGGSVNDMCAENKISKGLIYHYFGSKEALFCACLRRCFGKMEACLRAALPEDKGLKAGLRAFTGARRAFFDENAPERALFFQTLLNPPKALYDKVKEAKRSLDDFTVQYFRRLSKTHAFGKALRARMLWGISFLSRRCFIFPCGKKRKSLKMLRESTKNFWKSGWKSSFTA